MSPSIRFLITTGLGRNRARNCCVTCEDTKHSDMWPFCFASIRRVRFHCWRRPVRMSHRVWTHLCYKDIVLHLFSGFHDAYNSGFDFVLPVVVYLLSRLLPLWVRLSLLSGDCGGKSSRFGSQSQQFYAHFNQLTQPAAPRFLDKRVYSRILGSWAGPEVPASSRERCEPKEWGQTTWRYWMTPWNWLWWRPFVVGQCEESVGMQVYTT